MHFIGVWLDSYSWDGGGDEVVNPAVTTADETGWNGSSSGGKTSNSLDSVDPATDYFMKLITGGSNGGGGGGGRGGGGGGMGWRRKFDKQFFSAAQQGKLQLYIRNQILLSTLRWGSVETLERFYYYERRFYERQGIPDCINQYIFDGSDQEDSPLLLAVGIGRVDMTRWLLQNGANPFQREKHCGELVIDVLDWAKKAGPNRVELQNLITEFRCMYVAEWPTTHHSDYLNKNHSDFPNKNHRELPLSSTPSGAADSSTVATSAASLWMDLDNPASMQAQYGNHIESSYQRERQAAMAGVADFMQHDTVQAQFGQTAIRSASESEVTDTMYVHTSTNQQLQWHYHQQHHHHHHQQQYHRQQLWADSQDLSNLSAVDEALEEIAQFALTEQSTESSVSQSPMQCTSSTPTSRSLTLPELTADIVDPAGCRRPASYMTEVRHPHRGVYQEVRNSQPTRTQPQQSVGVETEPEAKAEAEAEVGEDNLLTGETGTAMQLQEQEQEQNNDDQDPAEVPGVSGSFATCTTIHFRSCSTPTHVSCAADPHQL